MTTHYLHCPQAHSTWGIRECTGIKIYMNMNAGLVPILHSPYQVSELGEIPAYIVKHIPDVMKVGLAEWAWPLSKRLQVHFHDHKCLGCEYIHVYAHVCV